MTSRKSTSTDHRCLLSRSFSSPDAAALVAASLEQEVGEIDDDRSEAAVSHTGDTVEITVTAVDLTALRAGCNTWGSLLEVAAGVAALEDE